MDVSLSGCLLLGPVANLRRCHRYARGFLHRSLRHRAFACSVTICLLGSAITLVAGTAEASPSSWSVTPSADPGVYNSFGGVSCSTPTSCFAVGGSATGGLHGETLVESWNGTTWSVVASPNRGNDLLTAVSCVTPDYCVAIGSHGNRVTLIESWNGTTWSIVSSPSPHFLNYLSSVSCVSATMCMAVGTYETRDEAPGRTFVEEWNGRTWSLVASPNFGQSVNMLTGVSCTSAIACVAVGSVQTGIGIYDTLVEAWNGRKWVIVSSPSPGYTNALQGVSCTKSTSCFAVGDYQPLMYSQAIALVESWNGSSWAVDSTPNPGSAVLYGVSCARSTDCIAVGVVEAGTLIESWNGSSWSVTPSPSPGVGTDELKSASCADATCMTAGTEQNEFDTLIEIGTTVASASVAPTSGSPGKTISVSGSGYAPGEQVNVKYETGLTPPDPTTLNVCSAIADSEGSFTCLGKIPPASIAGALGPHTIEAVGKISLATGTTTFTLT